MIKNITARKQATAVTQADFFHKLCSAMPKVFSLGGGGGAYGYYRDALELMCVKAPAFQTSESYVFRAEDPSSITQAALKEFVDCVKRVASRAGYDEVLSKSQMFAGSFFIGREKPTELRLLVKN